MKIFKLLILTAVLIFSLGLHSFAGHSEDHAEQDCVLICCVQGDAAEIPVTLSTFPSYQKVAKQIVVSIFNYKNPSLLGFKRPPIYLS